MRVLFISNDSTQRCGVRIFGDLWADALRGIGVEIDRWDGTYSTIYARGKYVPDNIGDYDLVHLNHDPQAINHYLPKHFSGVKKLSLFLHDVPPNSTCPVFGIANLVMAMEPGEGIHVIDHAVPDMGELPILTIGRLRPYIGVCGIRNDAGRIDVEKLCERRGWGFNGPSASWLTTEQEITRLAQSDVNVCWYHVTGRGKSMGAMFCVAARRPLVLSTSTMFSNLWPYEYEIMWGVPDSAESLEPAVEEALKRQMIPERARRELSWTIRAKEIKALWEAMV
jgi:hypothetical protein